MLTFVLLACKPRESTPAQAVLPAPGELLIEEFYYSGAVPAGGTDHYFADQFVELVNASDLPLDLSAVMLADAYGAAGAINPGMQPDSYASQDPERVVMNSVWRIPEGARLEPGETLVLAHDGTNHRPFSTIDLSSAAFETYVADSGGDDDHPTVDNLESVVFNGGFDWLVPVFGASIVLLEADADLGRRPGPFGRLPTAPTTAVLDAVEALLNADSAAFKRLPDSVDAGFTHVAGPYVGRSLHRRRTGEGWMDTDDSGADFERGEPDPGRPPDPDGVFGDASLELGVGARAFEPVSAGDPIELVAGAQGGWHLDVAVRFSGFGPEGIRLYYDALDTEGTQVSFATRTVLTEAGLLPDGEGWARVGDRVVLDIGSADDVVGDTLVVRVTAELAGQAFSDEREVQVVDQR